VHRIWLGYNNHTPHVTLKGERFHDRYLNLPPNVERAFVGEAAAKGLSLDEFVSELLLVLPGSRLWPGKRHSLRNWNGGWCFGIAYWHPIAISMIDETLDTIRREGDLTALGIFG
jgi:hypothetical protein